MAAMVARAAPRLAPVMTISLFGYKPVSYLSASKKAPATDWYEK